MENTQNCKISSAKRIKSREGRERRKRNEGKKINLISLEIRTVPSKAEKGISTVYVHTRGIGMQKVFFFLLKLKVVEIKVYKSHSIFLSFSLFSVSSSVMCHFLCVLSVPQFLLTAECLYVQSFSFYFIFFLCERDKTLY